MADGKEDWLPLFEHEASYWLSYFGLLDWSIIFRSEPLENTFAEARMNYVAKMAELVINNDYDPGSMNADVVKRSAFHEVCEVMLGSLYCQAERFCTSDYQHDMVAMAGHDIIRRLENTLYRDLKRP